MLKSVVKSGTWLGRLKTSVPPPSPHPPGLLLAGRVLRDPGAKPRRQLHQGFPGNTPMQGSDSEGEGPDAVRLQHQGFGLGLRCDTGSQLAHNLSPTDGSDLGLALHLQVFSLLLLLAAFKLRKKWPVGMEEVYLTVQD